MPANAGPTDLPLLRRLSAFTDDPRGGNPAGVWIGREMPEPVRMQEIAAEVGYSETAFLVARPDDGYHTRYFSPEAEVSFCGHATIAAGVLLGMREGAGTYTLDTAVGPVSVEVAHRSGRLHASLTSVPPKQEAVPPRLVRQVLETLAWRPEELDPGIPPRLAWAGVWHLVLAVASSETLDRLAYDFARLKALMLDADLTTLQLVWRQDETTFHARNPFPVGGVVEDPATGAAAAALGGYLRDAGLLPVPADFVIHQGVAMGRPSRIEVRVPDVGGICVTGTAVPIDDQAEAPGRS